jgi:hypothetical protein
MIFNKYPREVAGGLAAEIASESESLEAGGLRE